MDDAENGEISCLISEENGASQVSSRFVESDRTVQQLIEDNQNRNTARKMAHDVNLLTLFLREKHQEIRPLELISVTELDGYLSDFFLRVRKQDGSEYEPSSLRCFLASFERYLRGKQYADSIITAVGFATTRNSLKSRQKELKSMGKGNKPNAARAVKDAEVDVLFAKGVLGTDSPMSLLYTLWWNNTCHFGMRGGKEHRDLKWGDIKLIKSTTACKEHLKYNERQTKTRPGDDPKNLRTVNPTMWPSQNAARDPIAAYKKYSSERPESTKHDDAPFYLGINHASKSNKKWYKCQALGENKLDSMMKDMFTAAEIEYSGNVSNHSGRKTMIQKLKDNRVPDTDIIQITGHANIQSLNSYDELSTERQEIMSNILQGEDQISSALVPAFTPGVSQPVQGRVIDMTVAHPPMAAGTVSVTDLPPLPPPALPQCRPALQPMQLFSGAHISGGCINLTINTLNPCSPPPRKRVRTIIDSDSE